MHHIDIYKLGPVRECSLDIDRFSVLTGVQANGKSTIAKAIFFFRTVKDDILDIMMKVQYEKLIRWDNVLSKLLRDKFLRIFGSSWAMPMDMSMTYRYREGVELSIFLTPGRNPLETNPNYVNAKFSKKLGDFLNQLGIRPVGIMDREKKSEEYGRLSDFFDDDQKTLYIPAGRSMITLISDQLNYIMNSLDENQRRRIDYCTQSYIMEIQRLRPLFSEGMNGLLTDKLSRTLDRVNRSLSRAVIEAAGKILKGEYRYVDGEERLYLGNTKYVKINFASSGQQDVVWLLNILFYFLLENCPVYLIVEEPESHLYPNTQKELVELMGLFMSGGNAMLVTTHSPYVLGAFNNLLYCSQVAQYGTRQKDAVEKITDKRKWLSDAYTKAYYVRDGVIENGMSEQGLIKNELIDDASRSINEAMDELFEIKAKAEGWCADED